MLALDELKKMTLRELTEEVRRAGIDLLKLRLAIHAHQSKETARVKQFRRYIARMKMLKHLLEIEQAKENPKSNIIK